MMSLVIFFSIPSIILSYFLVTLYQSSLRGKFTIMIHYNILVMKAFSIMIIPLLLRAIDQIFQVENKLYIIVNRTIFGLILNIILNYVALFI